MLQRSGIPTDVCFDDSSIYERKNTETVKDDSSPMLTNKWLSVSSSTHERKTAYMQQLPCQQQNRHKVYYHL